MGEIRKGVITEKSYIRVHEGNHEGLKRNQAIKNEKGGKEPPSEREMGIEPTTLCLGSKCSTPELLPPECANLSYFFKLHCGIVKNISGGPFFPCICLNNGNFLLLKKKGQVMNNNYYIQSLIESEQRLKENFIKIAEFYKTEPGIYYGCQEMASISDDHLRKIRKEETKYSRSHNVADSGTPVLMIKEHEMGNDLFQDLRFMWLLTMEAAMFNNMLLQSFSEDSEDNPDNLYGEFERETEKQSQWLMYRINMTVRKASAHA